MLTEQEQFWAGSDGDAYTARNDATLVNAKIGLFEQALWSRERNISSVIEFGANRGLNIRALQHVLRNAKYTAVEINADACNRIVEELNGGFEAKVPPTVTICHASILALEQWPKARQQHDLALAQGLLIHINPDRLTEAYDALYHASSRYILIAEYFSPKPVEIEYRGQMGRLWKRDFAGDMLDRFPDLKVADYGFVWRRDPQAPLDDITWFLLEKHR